MLLFSYLFLVDYSEKLFSKTNPVRAVSWEVRFRSEGNLLIMILVEEEKAKGNEDRRETTKGK